MKKEDDEFKEEISKIIKEGFKECLKKCFEPPLQVGHRYLCEDNVGTYVIDVNEVCDSAYYIYSGRCGSTRWVLKSKMPHNVIEDITPKPKPPKEEKKNTWFQFTIR